MSILREKKFSKATDTDRNTTLSIPLLPMIMYYQDSKKPCNITNPHIKPDKDVQVKEI